MIIDLEVPAGEGYGLRSLDEDPQLWRDGPGSGIDYPYALGDLATIQQSTAGGNNAYNYYYFFYNWVVQTPFVACVSERVPVTISFVGIEGLDEIGFALYPNPTNGLVQLTWDRSSQSQMSYRLLDAFGRVVNQGLVQGNELIDWTGLAAGHYTFVAGENGTSGSLQVIIQ